MPGCNDAIILLSGGLDSATTLAVARHEGFRCHAISFDYGQRHRVELEAARRVARSLGAIEHRIVTIDLRAFGGSALTADIAVPKDRLISHSLEGGDQGVGRPTSPSSAVSRAGASSSSARSTNAPRSAGPSQGGRGCHDIPITYVPARNTIFLSFALGWAEVLGAADIFIGVNAVDYSGYPDCRPAFIEAFEQAANLGTRMAVEGRRITIHAPLIQMTKGQIIRRGIDLGVDYGQTFSCYDPLPGADGRPCGHCDSCLLRAAGFREAGVTDPALARTT
jgi:7-cyano-7-deazaguanine synthase